MATEAPETFVGFGASVLSPCPGRVVIAHDGEPDHQARRSQLTLLLYILGQAGRVQGGPAAIAGNHVVIATDERGPYILLAHLQKGSITVSAGDQVLEGAVVGGCGNSGNSTEPHVDLQAMDRPDPSRASAVAITFAGRLPRNGDVVDAG